MIDQLIQLPDNIVGFRATGEISEEDFKYIVVPAVDELVKRTGELNYLMVIDTSLKNFTVGAWWQDGLLGLKRFSTWRRVAIVTDAATIHTFTTLFSLIAPGEFKGFKPHELQEAIDWVGAPA